MLLLLDARFGAVLGRSSMFDPVDIDIELPSDFADSVPGYLYALIALYRVLNFALRILHSLNRVSVLTGLDDVRRVIAPLDTALDVWMSGLPPQLRWNPNQTATSEAGANSQPLLDQSAALHCMYYYLRILVHRRYLPSVAVSSGLQPELETVGICTNAARECIKVAIRHNELRPGAPLWFSQNPIFTAAMVLLLCVWDGTSAKAMSSSTGEDPAQVDLQLVKAAVKVLKSQTERWPSSEFYANTLERLLLLDPSGNIDMQEIRQYENFDAEAEINAGANPELDTHQDVEYPHAYEAASFPPAFVGDEEIVAGSAPVIVTVTGLPRHRHDIDAAATATTSAKTAMEHPFVELFRANTAPTDAQADQIRHAITASSPELEELEEEVTRLQELLLTAKKRRDVKREFIEQHRTILAPVRRLTDDILRVIFLATLSSHRDTAICADEGPLLVAQICRLWRDVALSTPRLWASIHIALPVENTINEQLLRVLTSWLRRSGAVPLSLTLATSLPFQHSPEMGAEVFELITSASRRWQSLHLSAFWSFSTIRSFASLDAQDVPLLRDITLGELSLEGAVRPDLRMLGTPSLQSLSYYGNLAFLPPYTSWGSLRRLKLSSEHYSSVDGTNLPFPFDILEQCILLEDFNFSATPQAMTLPETPRVVSLLHLCCFALHNLPALLWSILINRVHLPKLRSLGIYGTVENLTWILPIASGITALHLTAHSITTEALVHGLEAMPFLLELSMDKEPVASDADDAPNMPGFRSPPADSLFLQRLRYSSNPDTDLCSLLLRIRMSHINFVSDATMLDFIRSRSGASDSGLACANLTHASFYILRTRQLDLNAALAEETARGLQLSVQYMAPDPLKYSPKHSLPQNDMEEVFTLRGPWT